jgi:hypothetical protein
LKPLNGGTGHIRKQFATQEEFERFCEAIFPRATAPVGPGKSAIGNGWLNLEIRFKQYRLTAG